MDSEIKIRRYSLPNKIDSKKYVYNYFKNPKWESTQCEGKYCLHQKLIYFFVHENENQIFIDAWAEGAFGVIFPHKGRMFGIIDEAIIRNIEKELTDYFYQNNIKYSEEFTTVKGKSQLLTMLYVFAIPLVIAIILLYFSK
jgi:hypothetical protein